MSFDWPVVSLGDAVNFITGFPFASKYYTDDTSAPYLIRGDNVIQGTLRLEGVKRWPISDSADYDAYWLCENDVLLAMDRPWIEAGLKFAPVRSTDLPALLVQRVARLRGTDMLDSRFLKHLIANQFFTNYVLSIQTGTVVPHISGNQIKNYKFALPPLPEQRAIAATLSALDDKIELNNRINKTLEEMAQALFKRWFVDFEFPDENGQPYKSSDGEMEESELGLIPKGWKVGTISDIANLVRDNVTPSGFDNNDFYIGLEHIPRKCLALTQTGKAEDVSSNKTRFRESDILFGKLRPYFHKVVFAPYNGICSTDILVIRPTKSICWGSLLMHLFSEELIRHADACSSGTKMPRANWADISRYSIPLATDNIFEAFTKLVQPMCDKIKTNVHMAQNLISLRDALLPKLMSGEIRVPIEEVAANV